MPYGWHFTGKKLRDGSKLPRVGEWEVFTGKIKMCSSGLHVGKTPWDALYYAPGSNLRYVEYAEVAEEHEDKIVCARRRTIAQMDATEMLCYFTRMLAISVVHLWDAPDVALDYLMTGNCNNKTYLSIMSAVIGLPWNAARAAAAAAWDATSAAEWGAARDAARAASWAAATAAAAARATEWDAARDAARDEFNALVYECFENVIQK